jgi:hypothetical protein
MGGHRRIDEVASKTAEARQRAILVRPRELAVSDDIRHQDRRELSGRAHCGLPRED